MKITRTFAFRVTALLMLTALMIMLMVPVGMTGTTPPDDTYYSHEGSYRDVSICTFPTDLVDITNVTLPYACKQWYDMEFGTPDGVGNSTITISAATYQSYPFFFKTTVAGDFTFYVWGQMKLTADATGTLATEDNIIDVDVSVTVKNETGTYTTVTTIGDGSNDIAGSALIYMDDLYMDTWLGTSPSDSTMIPGGWLFSRHMPLVLTTGSCNITLLDDAPQLGSVSMDGEFKEATGVPFNLATGEATLVGAGAGLDVYAYLLGLVHSWTDYVFLDTEVISTEPCAVGGIWTPVDKLALLAPYIALASTIILAIAATAIFKYRKKP